MNSANIVLSARLPLGTLHMSFSVFLCVGDVSFSNHLVGSALGTGDLNGVHARAENRPRNRPILAPGRDVVVKTDLGPAVRYRTLARPPLAGPYAFSRIPAPHWDHPRVFLMHDPAKTWLFANLTSGYAIL